MPKRLTASLVAQEIQHMTHWGGIQANIQCTIASRSRLKNIVESRECERRREEAEDNSVKKVSESSPIESMMKNMMNSILATVDEKLKSASENSLPNVSNQSFATDRVIPAARNVTELDDPNPLKRGEHNWCIELLGYPSSVEKIHLVRVKRHMNNGYSM